MPDVQQGVLNALGFWISRHWSDFYVNRELFETVHLFAQFIHKSLGSEGAMIGEIISGADLLGKVVNLDEMPESLVPGNLKSVTEIHPLEVARQLTVTEWTLINTILRTEFLNKAWTQPETSPGLTMLAAHANKVCCNALRKVDACSG
jgi:hypothetical protein